MGNKTCSTDVCWEPNWPCPIEMLQLTLEDMTHSISTFV